jgi:hypothetical protein
VAKSTISISDRDQMFLAHAEKNKYFFDVENGIIYDINKKVLGTKSNHCHTLFFTQNKNQFAISRCRAIWLYVKGPIPDGFIPSHISENLSDDSINNIALCSKSERQKKYVLKNNWKGSSREKCGKLTLEIVNYARREALNPTVSYNDIRNQIKEKFDICISKTSILFAIRGKTWKDASEPPVLNKEFPLKEKKIYVREKTPSKAKPSLPNPKVEAVKICKSLLKNNPRISDKGVLMFLRMRNIDTIPFTEKKLQQIRKECGS